MRITVRLLTILLWGLSAAPAAAQVLETPLTITAASAQCLASNCVEVSLRGIESLGIGVAGGGTYTLVVEGTRDDGASWVTPLSVVDDTDTDALATSITAAGGFALNNSGFTAIRVRASVLSSGTPVVTLTRGELAPLQTPGAGGGGGAGTEYTEGATDASITGPAVLMEVAGNALAPLQGTVADGLLVNLGTNNDVTVTGSVTANAGTNLNTSALALESGGNLAAAAASLATLDDAVSGTEFQVDVLTMPAVTNAGTFAVQVDGAALTALQLIDNAVSGAGFNITQFGGAAVPIGAGVEATAVRVTVATDSTGVLSVDDNGGSLTVDGTVSCSNCSGSGASLVDDAAFGIATDSVAPTGFLFDDVTPDSVNEGDVGVARMSANRVPYGMIRDAAGNERGANVNASNQLAIAGPVTNAGTFAVQVDGSALTALQAIDTDATTLIGHVDGIEALLGTIDADTGNLAAIAASLSVLDDTAGETADEYVTVRLTDGASFLSVASDGTIGSAIGTSGPLGTAVYADFDGAALPTIANVDTEGELVPTAASIKGVQYTMLVSEDGSLQYGTATTPLVVGDGSGALNVIVDSGALTVSATNLDVQSGGADLATEATLGGVLTSTNYAAAFGTAGSADTQVMSVQGIASMTPLSMYDTANTTGGADALSYLSAGSTEDEHAVKATAGTLFSVTATNTNAAVRYLKCENDTAANTAPGTDTPELRIAIPGATTGAGFTTNFPKGWTFSTALTCWIVTGAADSDVAEVAANELIVFYTYK